MVPVISNYLIFWVSITKYFINGRFIMAYSNLFSPIKLRGLELKNRIIFPAMGTKMATEDKFVTQQLVDYQAARSLFRI